MPLKKPVRARARSVGAAAASDDNVTGATFYRDWWDGKLAIWAYLGMAAMVYFAGMAINLSVPAVLVGMAAAISPLVRKAIQMVTA